MESQDANIMDFIFFQVALATYYIMSGGSLKAADLLKKHKNFIEEKYQLKNILNEPFYYLKNNDLDLTHKTLCEYVKEQPDLSAIINKIKTKFMELPTNVLTVYAQILYHLGCIYYDIGDKHNKKFYYNCFEQALLIRHIIQLKTKDNKLEAQKDSFYNEYGVDTKIMERNGLWKFRYKETNFLQKLKDIANVYERMIRQEMSEKNVDRIHLQSCRSEQFRVYQKLAKLCADPALKQIYCCKAARIMYAIDYPGAFTVVSNKGVDYELIFNQIIANPHLKEDTRKARYLNDLANLLAIQDDGDYYELAARCYKEAIKLVEEKINVNSDLPSSYLGLAKLYLQQDNYSLAEKAIKRCQILQAELKMHQNHEEAEEAEKIASLLSCKCKDNFIEKIFNCK